MIRVTVLTVLLFTATVHCSDPTSTDPKQTEPMQEQPPQTEPMQGRPPQTEPMQGQPPQPEPMQGQPPLTQPMKRAHKLTDCPFAQYKKTIEEYLVESDPTELFQGTFIDYFVAPARGQTCDTTTYTLEADSQVTSVSTEKYENKEARVDCKERQKKNDRNGLYHIAGTYYSVKEGKDQEEKYEGKLYVFYANQNVIGYYYCEYVKDDYLALMTRAVQNAYNAVVSVKKDKVNDFIVGSGPEVKASVDKAVSKMRKIAGESANMFVGVEEEEEYFNRPFAVQSPTITENKHLTC